MGRRHTEIKSVSECTRARFSDLAESAFWSTSSARELRRHSIHAYPARFPAFITARSLQLAARHGIHVKTMADVFCGSGTTALEAQCNSLNYWGCDVNPVATLIARTKTQRYSPRKILEYTRAILTEFAKAKSEMPLSEVALQRLQYWHPAPQLADLGRLLNAVILAVPERSKYRQLFFCAFSSILKQTSLWAARAIKPTHDPSKRVADVLQTFVSQCDVMALAWNDGEKSHNTSVNIVDGCALTAPLPKNSIDLIVTSPPYAISYEYADLHQLSALWLGYASDYRELRHNAIGSAYNAADLKKTARNLNAVGSRIVFTLYPKDKNLAHIMAQYYCDMQAIAHRCFDILQSDGMAVFVIGDTEYKGVEIENAAHMAESFLSCGFANVRVEKRRVLDKLLPSHRGKCGRFSSTCDASRRTYHEEYVLVARKS